MPLTRLDQVASMVRPCTTAVDIGTDHGYLALKLLKSGIAQHVIATDLRPLPIKQAQKTFAQANVTEGVTFVISDGLLSVDQQPQTAILAGMGGELAIKIIQQSLDRFMAMQQIVIQANSHLEKVRHYVWTHGFEIESEQVTYEGFFYPMISIHYTGKIRQVDLREAFLGEGLNPRDPLVRAFYEHECQRYAGILAQHPHAQQAKDRLTWLTEALNSQG